MKSFRIGDVVKINEILYGSSKWYVPDFLVIKEILETEKTYGSNYYYLRFDQILSTIRGGCYLYDVRHITDVEMCEYRKIKIKNILECLKMEI